jgi:hypothetical protein
MFVCGGRVDAPQGRPDESYFDGDAHAGRDLEMQALK